MVNTGAAKKGERDPAAEIARWFWHDPSAGGESELANRIEEVLNIERGREFNRGVKAASLVNGIPEFARKAILVLLDERYPIPPEEALSPAGAREHLGIGR